MAMAQQPTNFEDLTVLNAIIRPGVADFGEYMGRREGAIQYSVRGEHDSYMGATYGLMVFQEQYLQLANTIAGWELAYADKWLRKNYELGPKGSGVDEERWKLFLEGGRQRGYEDEYIKATWDEICNILRNGYGLKYGSYKNSLIQGTP